MKAAGGRFGKLDLPYRLLDHLREGDTLVVWKLDRLSRSLKDVLHIMERIAEAGAGFRGAGIQIQRRAVERDRGAQRNRILRTLRRIGLDFGQGSRQRGCVGDDEICLRHQSAFGDAMKNDGVPPLMPAVFPT